MSKVLEASSVDAYNHVKSMAATVGYQIVMHQWAERREIIIKEACASRAEEKKIKNLARLQGFQEAIDMVNIILSNPPLTQKFEDDD